MDEPRENRQSFWQRDGIFLVLLGLIFVLRYLPPFLRGDLFGPFRDNIWIYGPIFSRAAEIALHGSYPYWIDTILTGLPIFDTPHFSTTYPFYFFGLLNYGVELDAVSTLTQLTFFHLLILYVNSYILIRIAGANGFGALCGATVGLVSGSTVGFATWITIIASYSWFPLLIAAAIRVLRRPGLGSMLLLSVSSSLLITASPAQSVIHSLLFCVIFFGFGLFWCARNLGKAHVLHVSCCLLLALAITTALTAVATIPMTIDTADMIRHVGDRSAVIGHQLIPWHAFTRTQLRPAQLWNVFADSRPLGILGGPYVGTLGLLGAGLCWLGIGQRDKFGKFVIIASSSFAIYGLLAALGTHTGLAQVHFHLPLLNRIREAGRYLIFFTTFVSLLAGLGFDSLARFRLSQFRCPGRRWPRAAAITLCIVCSVTFIVEVFTAYRSHNWRWLPLLAIPAGLLLLYWHRKSITALAAVGLALSCFTAAVAYDGISPRYVASYYDTNNLIALRLIRRLAALPNIGDSRVAFRDSKLWPGHWAMDASFYGIRSFYADMTPVPYDQFRDLNRESLPHYRELMGARYIVCGEKENPRNATDTLLFRDGPYSVYETEQPMASATLVHALAGQYSNAAEFYSIVRRGFDYNHFAYVDAQDYQRLNVLLRHGAAPVGSAADFLQIVKKDANKRVICVETDTPALLILNEYCNRAWHARINGQEAQVFRVNLNQLGTFIRAGHNVVDWEYKPRLFHQLLMLQRLMFLTLLFGISAILLYHGRWLGVVRRSRLCRKRSQDA